MIQNGLGQEERLPAVAFEGAIYAALGFVCATKVGPGHIHHLDYGQLRLAQFVPGRRAAGVTNSLRALADDLQGAGIAIQVDEDYLRARWKKLVWNIPFNGLSVVLGTDTRHLVASPHTLELIRAVMREVVAGAIAKMVMDSLRDLDKVAYVRFASVYREFEDVQEFMNELRDLLGSRK